MILYDVSENRSSRNEILIMQNDGKQKPNKSTIRF